MSNRLKGVDTGGTFSTFQPGAEAVIPARASHQTDR